MRFEGLSAGQVFLELIVDGETKVSYENESTWNCLSANIMVGGKTNGGAYYCEVCITPVADCSIGSGGGMPTFACSALPNVFPFVMGQFAGAYSLCLSVGSGQWSSCTSAFTARGPTLANPSATVFTVVAGGNEYVLDPVAGTITVTTISSGIVRVYEANPPFCPLGETRFDLISISSPPSGTIPCHIKTTALPCWGFVGVQPLWRYRYDVSENVTITPGGFCDDGIGGNICQAGGPFGAFFPATPPLQQSIVTSTGNNCIWGGVNATNACGFWSNRLIISPAAGTVDAQWVQSGIVVVRWRISYSSWNWFGVNVLSKIVDNGWCQNWPSTLTLTAVPIA